MLSTKLWKSLLLLGVSWSVSCAGVWAGRPPACPPITVPAVDDVEELIVSDTHEALLIWIGEVDRYCDGIKAMRGN